MSIATCGLLRPDGKTPCGRVISTAFPVHACRAAAPLPINGKRDTSGDEKRKKRRKAKT